VSFGDVADAVGVHLRCNVESREELPIAGIDIDRLLDVPCPIEDEEWSTGDAVPAGSGSIIAIIATDAPLLPQQLAALARRVPLGLARTGTTGSRFPGGIFLAFSTANEGSLRSEFPRTPAAPPSLDSIDSIGSIPWGSIDPFSHAVVAAVEEAVLNALVANDDMVGREGSTSDARPIEAVRGLIDIRWTTRREGISSQRPHLTEPSTDARCGPACAPEGDRRHLVAHAEPRAR
jgi:L-aminopeptidase/D-esterase-like protein